MTRNSKLILAGDVGGTNTRLAIFKQVADQLHCQHHAVYPSANFSSLEQIIVEFIASQSEQG